MSGKYTVNFDAMSENSRINLPGKLMTPCSSALAENHSLRAGNNRYLLIFILATVPAAIYLKYRSGKYAFNILDLAVLAVYCCIVLFPLIETLYLAIVRKKLPWSSGIYLFPEYLADARSRRIHLYKHSESKGVPEFRNRKKGPVFTLRYDIKEYRFPVSSESRYEEIKQCIGNVPLEDNNVKSAPYKAAINITRIFDYEIKEQYAKSGSIKRNLSPGRFILKFLLISFATVLLWFSFSAFSDYNLFREARHGKDLDSRDYYLSRGGILYKSWIDPDRIFNNEKIKNSITSVFRMIQPENFPSYKERAMQEIGRLQQLEKERMEADFPENPELLNIFRDVMSWSLESGSNDLPVYFLVPSNSELAGYDKMVKEYVDETTDGTNEEASKNRKYKKFTESISSRDLSFRAHQIFDSLVKNMEAVQNYDSVNFIESDIFTGRDEQSEIQLIASPALIIKMELYPGPSLYEMVLSDYGITAYTYFVELNMQLDFSYSGITADSTFNKTLVLSPPESFRNSNGIFGTGSNDTYETMLDTLVQWLYSNLDSILLSEEREICIQTVQESPDFNFRKALD